MQRPFCIVCNELRILSSCVSLTTSLILLFAGDGTAASCSMLLACSQALCKDQRPHHYSTGS